MNSVLMSGLGLGFLHSWCCQFKLQIPHINTRGTCLHLFGSHSRYYKLKHVKILQRKYQNGISIMWKYKNMETYLWFIKVRRRDAFRVGKPSLSRNKGLASISFLSSTSIMLRADFVSPYLDNCSFSLHLINILLLNPEAIVNPYIPCLIITKATLCLTFLFSQHTFVCTYLPYGSRFFSFEFKTRQKHKALFGEFLS